MDGLQHSSFLIVINLNGVVFLALMVLQFNLVLNDSLKRIDFTNYHEINVHPHSSVVEHSSIVGKYNGAKLMIIELLNKQYNTEFNLHNWINYNENDEVAYFLNEVGNNSLHYSEFGCAAKFHLWKGSKGFVIGIEQKGKGFDAKNVNENRVFNTQGKGFEFFRNCSNVIFFDDSKNAKIVYMECLL